MEKITYAFPKIKGIEPSIYIDAYNLVLECSNTRTPKEFCIRLIKLAARICPYDQAIAFFIDKNGKIAGFYSVGTKEGWLETYLNYYIEMTDGDFSFKNNLPESSDANRIINWNDVPDSVFKREYIDAVHLKHTWAFTFYDMDGSARVTICFDRRHEQPFTEKEQTEIRLALPILNNMHRNFYYKDVENVDTAALWAEYSLTKREKEIADMLCQGTKASRIADLLYISQATAHKHIAHIYRKVGVTSHQELISRMLSKRSLL